MDSIDVSVLILNNARLVLFLGRRHSRVGGSQQHAHIVEETDVVSIEVGMVGIVHGDADLSMIHNDRPDKQTNKKD